MNHRKKRPVRRPFKKKKPFYEKNDPRDGKRRWWERRNQFVIPEPPPDAKEFGWRSRIKPIPSRSDDT